MSHKHLSTIYFAHYCSAAVRRIKETYKFIKSRDWKSGTYYPELPRKSSLRIICDQLKHIAKYGFMEENYFAYGFDVAGWRNQDEFLDERDYLWKCYLLNAVFPPYDYTCILRDKSLFADVLTAWNFATPHVICSVTNDEERENALCAICQPGAYFCKPLDGVCGRGTHKIVISETSYQLDGVSVDKEDLINRMREVFLSGQYVIQTLVEQHPKISEIYADSINTVRLITIYDKNLDSVIPISAILRTGANGSIMDNWSSGGGEVGIDLSTGELGEYGFFNNKVHRVNEHPTTHVTFKGRVLPYFDEVKKSACELHYKLKMMPIIGWDIAITPSGPLFIEGNDNSGLNQVLDGGVKATYVKYFGKIFE